MMLDYIPFAVAALLVIGNIIVRLIAARKAQFVFSSVMLAVLAASLGALMAYGSAGTVAGILSLNPFSLFFALLFTVGLLLINFIAFNYSDAYQDFAVISAFSLLGMYAVAMSTSLITIFLGLELTVLPMVFAILLSRRGIEAAVKLFIMASIAIAVLSFAIVMVYGAEGSLALASYPQDTLLAFSALLFIAALGFEASVFPFNVLLPDVYTGSPAYVTGMLGGINKKVGFAALMQVLILVFITNSAIFAIVAVLATLTMFYGNIVALLQKNTKRMLAYSSISQAGYILIGIAVSNQSGIAASLFQIFAHLFIFIGMMGVISFLEKKNRAEIDELIGLNSENRLAAFSLSIFMLSLIGLPLTTGFVGKFLLFLSAINAGLVWLAMVGIVNSVISVFYYAKVIMAMYAEKEGSRRIVMDRPLEIAIIACVAVTIVFGVYPEPVIGLANSAAAFLFR